MIEPRCQLYVDLKLIDVDENGCSSFNERKTRRGRSDALLMVGTPPDGPDAQR
jgi:hypothetical protein